MPQAMLDISNPKYIVVCSSADRRFNSAHPSVIERAQEHLLHNHKKGGIYVTGLDGTIIFPPVLTQA
jgi:beta-lactamase superfamily II metal-dependent hydrolase